MKETNASAPNPARLVKNEHVTGFNAWRSPEAKKIVLNSSSVCGKIKSRNPKSRRFEIICFCTP
jgi:hypothetical protein